MNSILLFMMIVSLFINMDKIMFSFVFLSESIHKYIKINIESDKILIKYLEQEVYFSSIQDKSIKIDYHMLPFVMDLSEYKKYKGVINE